MGNVWGAVNIQGYNTMVKSKRFNYPKIFLNHAPRGFSKPRFVDQKSTFSQKKFMMKYKLVVIFITLLENNRIGFNFKVKIHMQFPILRNSDFLEYKKVSLGARYSLVRVFWS